MSKLAIIALSLFAILAATNPREDEHARALIGHARQGCADSALGKLLCGGMAALASPSIDYRDHMAFSTAGLGDSQSIGVLGRVFIVDR